MTFLTSFVRFWSDFVIGDDWTIAAAVVGALAITAVLAQAGVASWWLLPLAVLLVLGGRLWRGTRTA
jgi:hypothetical protein